jgi:Zn-dependent alcohol dehydrogenase
MRMRAAVSREGQPHPVIESVDLEEPRAGETLVRIVATGICHTDLRAHRGGILPAADSMGQALSVGCHRSGICGLRCGCCG